MSECKCTPSNIEVIERPHGTATESVGDAVGIGIAVDDEDRFGNVEGDDVIPGNVDVLSVEDVVCGVNGTRMELQ